MNKGLLLIATHSLISTHFGCMTISLKLPFTSAALMNGWLIYRGGGPLRSFRLSEEFSGDGNGLLRLGDGPLPVSVFPLYDDVGDVGESTPGDEASLVGDRASCGLGDVLVGRGPRVMDRLQKSATRSRISNRCER